MQLDVLINFALYIVLSRDVPLTKPDFSLRSEFLVSVLVDVFRTVEESNPQRYTCRQELMDFLSSLELHQSMLNSSF